MTSKTPPQPPSPGALRKASPTGRITSSEPSLQNFSVSTPESRRVIEAFMGPNGFEVKDTPPRKRAIWS